MAPVTGETVRALLGDLSREAFVEFVAALWAARGREVRREDELLVAEGPAGREVLQPVADPDADLEPAADVVVAAVDLPEPPADRDVLGPDDLRELLLYGVAREDATALFEATFDRPLVADGSDDPGQDRERTTGDSPDGDGQSVAHEASGGADGGAPDDGGTAGPGRQEWRPDARSALVVVGTVVLVVGFVAAGVGPFGPADPGGPDVGSASPPAGSTEVPASVTPAGGATGQPSDTPVPVANDVPGFAGYGIVDASALASGHAATLSQQSYTVAVTYREQRQGRVTASRLEVVTVEAPAVYRTTVTESGAPPGDLAVVADAETYADGEHRYERLPDGTVVRQPVRERSLGTGRYAARVADTLATLLEAERSFVVDTVERDGTTFYWVRLTGHPDLVNATGVAVVSADGVVHEVHRTYDHPDRDARVAVSVQTRGVGGTTVQPPSWYDAARNATAVAPSAGAAG